MALEINTQYTKFVQFAEAEMHKGNEEAIARDGGGPLDGRTITASDTDSVLGTFKWYRSPDDKRANNQARELFRQAIINIFGGSEANIPQNVKDAMELHNFNNEGHPLTARRMTGYLKELLSHPENFNDGFFSVFRLDLERDSVHFINGKKVRGKTLEARTVPFRNAIKDPEKLKAVSAVINQQLWADYTLLCCRMPLHPSKAGLQPDPVNTIPGIEKFVSRDVMETGMQTLGTGQMVFKINVSPDESIATVTSTSDYPINGDFAMPEGSTLGKCKVSQELVIDFTGAEPVIRDYKVGQALE